MRTVRTIIICGGVLLAMALHHPAAAASLQVMPVLLDLVEGNNGVLHLRNEGTKPVDVQVRIFRWRQQDGVETLEPAAEVVASPPLTTVQPGTDYSVRIVREAPALPVGEEAYRVWIDELPANARAGRSGVNFTVRSVIPIFFRSADASLPKVQWIVSRQGSQMVLVGRNEGDQRLRLSDLSITDGNHRVVDRKGLFGYVLGHSTMKWRLPATGAFGFGRALTVRATSQDGLYSSAVQAQ